MNWYLYHARPEGSSSGEKSGYNNKTYATWLGTQ